MAQITPNKEKIRVYALYELGNLLSSQIPKYESKPIMAII